jgi:hypothetical protein
VRFGSVPQISAGFCVLVAVPLRSWGPEPPWCPVACLRNSCSIGRCNAALDAFGLPSQRGVRMFPGKGCPRWRAQARASRAEFHGLVHSPARGVRGASISLTVPSSSSCRRGAASALRQPLAGAAQEPGRGGCAREAAGLADRPPPVPCLREPGLSAQPCALAHYGRSLASKGMISELGTADASF